MTRFRPRIPLALATLCALAGVAHADDPKFTFDKKSDVKEVVWKATALLGGFGSTGNSETATINGGLSFSRFDGWNKIAFDAGGAYSTVWNRRLTVTNDAVKGLDTTQVYIRDGQPPAAANWMAKLRYDRFFSERDSLYIAGFVGEDFVLNKDIVTGGQLGYSRLLVKTDSHELAGEAGYDLQYTHYKDTGAGTSETLVHSIRLFLGYVLTLRKDTTFNASAEAFINANNVDIGTKFDPKVPGSVDDPNTRHGFGEASRFVGRIGLTTLIWQRVSFKVGGTFKYDNAPPELSGLKQVNADGTTSPFAFAPDYQGARPRFSKWDLIGDFAIVVTIL